MTAAGLLSRYRLVAALVMAATLWMSISYTQTLFDQSDRRKALTLLLLPPDGGTSLADVLTRENGGAPPVCEARIDSAVAGTLTVSCPLLKGELRYGVDLLGKRVTPLDDRSAEAWRQRSAPAAATPPSNR